MATVVGTYRVGSENSFRYNNSGQRSVLNFTVAENNPRFREDNERLNKHPKTNWYEVTLWGQMADNYAPGGQMAVRPGDLLEIAGELGVETMLDKNGSPLTTSDGSKDHPRTKMVLANVYKIRKLNPKSGDSGHSEEAAESTVPPARPANRQPVAAAPAAGADFDDEIPF